MFIYQTLSGEDIRINEMSAVERMAVSVVLDKFETSPDYIEFGNWWQSAARPVRNQLNHEDYTDSEFVKICIDLEARLAIVQGALEPSTPEALGYLARAQNQAQMDVGESVGTLPQYTVPTPAHCVNLLEQAGYDVQLTKKT